MKTKDPLDDIALENEDQCFNADITDRGTSIRYFGRKVITSSIIQEEIFKKFEKLRETNDLHISAEEMNDLFVMLFDKKLILPKKSHNRLSLRCKPNKEKPDENVICLEVVGYVHLSWRKRKKVLEGIFGNYRYTDSRKSSLSEPKVKYQTSHWTRIEANKVVEKVMVLEAVEIDRVFSLIDELVKLMA